ncbi:hypothetical protein DICPUDRAFT_152800 [Dictyostelium purpureum]|uniref:Uncharacterized protein n=1 Tax=Dictyostelium purpureum TaxID=5786 RepID=F0ZMA8_DICPU|nr:uncharacterized protein DICPUDRAFT_152800 [Dictyostelium purpureum]EGC34911.1 hypothetical protein DICPUDRAFT_152800 [Dictyostelium purpureum]|eukprot:XP_003288544.1 hypothetical protein DICPUDRAFT_152800 [Dictyostelium purpureum]
MNTFNKRKAINELNQSRGKIVTEELFLVDSDTYARPKNKYYGISLEEVINNEINPSSSVDHVLGKYKDFKFHLVGDSAFFPKDNLNHIVNKGWLATISDSSSSNINTLLKDTLKDDKSWIAIE